MTATARGSRVTLVYTKPPLPLVAATIAKLQDNGAVVTVIGPQFKGQDDAGRFAGASVVRVQRRVAPVYFDRNNPPRRYSPAWVWLVIRNLWRKVSAKPAQRLLPASALWWRAIARNRDAVHNLREADVITALDVDAVYSVWRAARENEAAAAIDGLAPTLRHFALAE